MAGLWHPVRCVDCGKLWDECTIAGICDRSYRTTYVRGLMTKEQKEQAKAISRRETQGFFLMCGLILLGILAFAGCNALHNAITTPPTVDHSSPEAICRDTYASHPEIQASGIGPNTYIKQCVSDTKAIQNIGK